MQNLRWIKLWCDLFSNRKICHLRKLERGNDYCLIWIYLLLLAARINMGGRLAFARGVPYTAELIAREGNFKLSTVKEALELFFEYRMISLVRGFYKIKNFLKYQSLEEYEKKKEQGRQRAKKYREKSKLQQNRALPSDSLDISEEEMEKLKIQLSEENIEHYLSVAKRSVEKGKRPKSIYGFIIRMAKQDKKLKTDEKTGINQTFKNEMERLKLPDAELDPNELAFKIALKRSYSEDFP